MKALLLAVALLASACAGNPLRPDGPVSPTLATVFVPSAGEVAAVLPKPPEPSPAEPEPPPIQPPIAAPAPSQPAPDPSQPCGRPCEPQPDPPVPPHADPQPVAGAKGPCGEVPCAPPVMGGHP